MAERGQRIQVSGTPSGRQASRQSHRCQHRRRGNERDRIAGCHIEQDAGKQTRERRRSGQSERNACGGRLEPIGENQDRGNSGVLLMNRYEIQVLDSSGTVTYADGQAGALYGQWLPLVNPIRKQGEWQV